MKTAKRTYTSGSAREFSASALHCCQKDCKSETKACSATQMRHATTCRTSRHSSSVKLTRGGIVISFSSAALVAGDKFANYAPSKRSELSLCPEQQRRNTEWRRAASTKRGRQQTAEPECECMSKRSVSSNGSGSAALSLRAATRGAAGASPGHIVACTYAPPSHRASHRASRVVSHTHRRSASTQSSPRHFAARLDDRTTAATHGPT